MKTFAIVCMIVYVLFPIFKPTTPLAQNAIRCTSGDCHNGYGVEEYPDNGTKYAGNFANSKRNGEGIYHFPDGSKFWGTWYNDSLNGDCKYYEGGKTGWLRGTCADQNSRILLVENAEEYSRRIALQKIERIYRRIQDTQ